MSFVLARYFDDCCLGCRSVLTESTTFLLIASSDGAGVPVCFNFQSGACRPFVSLVIFKGGMF